MCPTSVAARTKTICCWDACRGCGYSSLYLAQSPCAGVLLHPALAGAEDGGAEWNLEAGPTAMSLMERGIAVASPS
jgi:hypothetical protein